MRVNWRKFAFVFLMLQIVVLCSGCGGWVTAVQALIPALEAAVSAVVAFIAALEGKTVPANIVLEIQTWGSNALTELGNVSKIIATVTSDTAESVIQQIGAVFDTILANTKSILAGLNVTDSATVSKGTSLIQLVITAVESILSLIPLASAVPLAQVKEHAAVADKAAASSIKASHKQLQAEYHTIVTSTTGKAEVDTALAALPQTLP